MSEQTESAGRDAALKDFEDRAIRFLEENVPRLDQLDPSEAKVDHHPDVIARDKATQAKIYDAGFAALTYPTEYGGQGLGEAESIIWQSLVGEYDIPRMTFMVSHGMCGPIIDLLGTHEQKLKYLPRLWRGDINFSQMFSEPGAGSDIAGLQTRAEKVEGGWRVTGQKIWTSMAQHADHGILIARTNPDVPKHQGLTMFIANLHDPALTIRPLRVANGDYPFNEVFIDGLFIPDEDRLSEVDKGWDAVVAMLRFERISLSTRDTETVGPLAYENLLADARRAGLDQNPATRRALAEAYILEQGNDLLALRMRQEVEAGIELGARGSIAKLANATSNWRLTEILSDIEGPQLIAWESDSDDYPPVTAALSFGPAAWTAGGTTEIQRNIVGERVLGLEKDPPADAGVPFREIRRSR